MTVAHHCQATRACYCHDGGSTVQRARAVRMYPARAQHHSLLSLKGRHGEQVQGQLCRRALHSRVDGLDTTDHLLSEGAVCTRLRNRVLRRWHAARRTGAVWLRQSYSSDLATQHHPSQPYNRLLMAMHMGGRLAYSS